MNQLVGKTILSVGPVLVVTPIQPLIIAALVGGVVIGLCANEVVREMR